MRTTPDSFYEMFVQLNFEDYKKTPYDIRIGYNAALSAFQLTDIFYAFYGRENSKRLESWKTKKDLLKYLSEIEPYFRTIQSVATVYKHLHAKGSHYDMETTGSCVSIGTSGMQLDSDCRDGDVMIIRRDGTKVSLKLALEKVVNEMWPNFLRSQQNS